MAEAAQKKEPKDDLLSSLYSSPQIGRAHV